ncbi:hypothetical protein EI94DRAFT_1609169, partial [Lactarius quietus]
PFGDAYEKIGTIQRRLAWPLHKDDTLFQSGRPTGLNIYFFTYCNFATVWLCIVSCAIGCTGVRHSPIQTSLRPSFPTLASHGYLCSVLDAPALPVGKRQWACDMCWLNFSSHSSMQDRNYQLLLRTRAQTAT